MYTLHIGNKNYSSWSLRPWALMRALAIPFREEMHPFDGMPCTPEYGAFSPSGRVPLLDDGGVLVWDSLAIIEHLAERHPGVWPTDPVARSWARSASAEMHSSFSALRNVCGMSCGIRVKLHERPAALENDIERVGSLWAEGIRRFGGPFLAGPAFTGVDAMFAPVTFRALIYGLDFGAAGNTYAERIRALPAMRDWYEAALAETWREEAHELDMAAAGQWTADYRAKV